LARRYGWTDEQINDLANAGQRSDFTPQEKIALRVAESLTRDQHSLDDALFTELRQQFDEPAVVELIAAIGLFNYFNLFNDALKMEPTK
jgi:alkylhydroperoxidase family enzyme